MGGEAGRERNDWRFWQEQQGLADSFVGGLSRDLTGAVWMVHGDINQLTRFDGRDFTVVKGQSLYRRFDSADGKNGWAIDHQGLHQLQDGRWNSVQGDTAEISGLEFVLRVLDLGKGRALLLRKSGVRILESLTTSAGRPAEKSVALPEDISTIGAFVTFERALDGSVWIIGKTGVARFRYDLPEGIGNWEIYPLTGGSVSELRSAIACPQGELFVSGLQRPGDRSVALRLWRGKWQVVARQQSRDQSLLAWRDGNGDMWRVEANVLFRKPAPPGGGGEPLSAASAGEWERIDTRSQVLTGQIAQVLVNLDGTFFVATSRGLALHVKSAWTAFGTVPDSHGRQIEMRQWLTSVIEDHRQRLWFLGQRSLFRHEGSRWDEYNLPKGFRIENNDPSGLGELKDGRILIQLFQAPWLATFDPDKLTFSPVTPPGGYKPLIFAKRPDGQFDIVLASLNGAPDALGLLDAAGAFSSVSPVSWKWSLNFPRAMLRSRKDELWLGSTTGLWRMRNNKLKQPGYARVPPERTDSGDPRSAYALLEEENGQILVGGRKALYRWADGRLRMLSSQIDAARTIICGRDGVTWIASGSGVFRSFVRPLRPRDHRGGLARDGSARDWFANDETEGLPSTLIQSLLQDSQGRIWAATTRGPAVYSGGTDSDAPRTTIRAEENTSEAASSGQVRFKFSGLDKWNITPPGLMLFSHRLDRGAWSPFAASDEATYRGVSEGRHHFEVVALDRQGNIDPVPARFSVSVAPPWYRTSGFQLILSLGLGIIGWLVCLAIRHIRQLQEMATRDGLTLNWNRRTIFQLLNSELEQAKKSAGQVAVIMVDVDEFKKINDKYGHPVGDVVLREISRRLRGAIRSTDKLGRYGGEEFLIVLPDCGRADAIARAEQLRCAVESEPILTGDRTLNITCSFGVDWTREGCYDVQRILREADSALYRAKRAGRNRVETAVPKPTVCLV